MLASSSTHSSPHSPRTNRTPIAISYPMPQDDVPLPTSSSTTSFSYTSYKYSPPTTPRGHHRQRPSLSNPMHWLSRTHSNTGSISKASLRGHGEHKSIKSIEILSPQRRGILGAGATVVRTPDEALRDSTVRLTYGDPLVEEVPPKVEPEAPQQQQQPLPSDLRGRLQERQLTLRKQQRFVPQEAVEESDEPRPEDSSKPEPITHIPEQPQLEVDQASVHSELPSPPYSPPLPSLPISEPGSFVSDAPSVSPSHMQPPRPQRTPPPAPGRQALPPLPQFDLRHGTVQQPISIARSTSTYSSDQFPLPPLPPTSLLSTTLSCIPPLANPSTFRAILLSEVPDNAIDPSKIIITLESSTSSYRTTMDTLCSRPSHLANYLTALLAHTSRDKESDAASVYSVQSDDVSTYQHHLTGLGLFPQSSFSMHIFLDRPSAPYAHILNYLRSPAGTQDHPESLPHPVRLSIVNHYPSHFNSNASRVDALFELREEAHYLGLEHLVELCTDELARYARLDTRIGQSHLVVRSVTPRIHGHHHIRQKSTSSSASGSASIHSMQASVHSLHESDPGDVKESKEVVAQGEMGSTPDAPHVVRKRTTVKPELRPSPPHSTEHQDSFHSVDAKSMQKRENGVGSMRSPPTPQSWLGSQRSRSQSSNGSVRRLPQTPPAGWI